MTEAWRELNRANWDERVAVHLGPRGYDLAALRAGAGRLDAITESELGPVAGQRVIHPQCHIGTDSLALAQRGATEVVGLDFSEAAIVAARRLATELGLINARFLLGDVYDTPALIGASAGFDLAFATWGTLCWLPDVAAWARVLAAVLRPGGVLYFADAHPTAFIFDDMAGAADAEGRPGWFAPYFDGAPIAIDDASDYADDAARLTNSRTIQFMHTLSDILTALAEAGLRLDWLHEHARLPWRMFRTLIRDGDGLWTWPDRPWLPLAVSLRATRN